MEKHKCQGIDPDGKHCESIETEKYEIFGDANLYQGLWVEIWLCNDCKEEFVVG